MLNKRWILCIIGTFFLTSCASSPYVSANNEEDDLGSSRLQKEGIAYLLGYGVTQSDNKAFYYFQRAAENDNPLAQNELAYLYASGRGTSQNYKEAFKWYQKAANNGLPSAAYSLGLLYEHGLGITKNAAKAREFFKKAADQGFQPAIRALR